MISSYKVVGDKIHIHTPYADPVATTCRSWGGKYTDGCWQVGISRLKEVQDRLGAATDDLVEVETSYWNEPTSQLMFGWYVLAGRRSRDRRADIYADLVTGAIPGSGGSVKNPSVCPSANAKFRLWVPRDFAQRMIDAYEGIKIITDPRVAEDTPTERPEVATARAALLALTVEERDALIASLTCEV